jgi:hypothetical protein
LETLLVNSVNPVQVELTDFVGNPEAARGNINAWVEKLTKGHIKDLGREREGPPCTFIFASIGFFSREEKRPNCCQFSLLISKSRFGGFGFLCIIESYQYICELST